jgi:hypothetical protein
MDWYKSQLNSSDSISPLQYQMSLNLHSGFEDKTCGQAEKQDKAFYLCIIFSILCKEWVKYMCNQISSKEQKWWNQKKCKFLAGWTILQDIYSYPMKYVDY